MIEFRRIIELVILGLWVAIAAMIYVNYSDRKILAVPEKLLPQLPKSETGKTFEVKKITVVRGDSFDLTIKDGDDSRLLVKLPVVAVENAKGKVLDILNHSTKPKVFLRERQPDGRWIVDLFFTNEDKEINLSDWLVTNKLVYK